MKEKRTALKPKPRSQSQRAGGTIRVGIGGWTYPPWRGVFYPEGLPHAQELHYASRHLTTIEVNGTFYRTQSPATYASWAKAVPDGFVFSLKAPRATTFRRVLAEAEPSIARFLASGPLELGDRLGPILWQLPPTKRFDEPDLRAFLQLLPATYEGHSLRHAVEVRHASFVVPEFVRLLREFDVAVVTAEHDTYPQIADITAGFVYARLQKGQDSICTAYRAPALERWSERLREWSNGQVPEDLEAVGNRTAAEPAPRDVFAYVIHEGKLRAPAAAEALIERVAPHT